MAFLLFIFLKVSALTSLSAFVYPVSEVKDERNCNASYIFASVSAFETAYAQNKNLPSAINFSEQWILSNSTETTCEGGTPDLALDIMESIGICQELFYPYYGLNIFLSLPIQATLYQINGYAIQSADYAFDFFDELQSTSLIVGFQIDDANTFLNYTGGIYNCSNTTTGQVHYMLAVYNTNSSVFLKNSWGNGWGINGFMNLNVEEQMKFPGPCGIFYNYYKIIYI